MAASGEGPVGGTRWRSHATILVVEDESSIASLRLGLFRNAGYAVKMAANGTAVLALAASEHPALTKPDLDASWTSTGSKSASGSARTPDAPILMLTARDEYDVDKIIGPRSGDDYLTKARPTRASSLRASGRSSGAQRPSARARARRSSTAIFTWTRAGARCMSATWRASLRRRNLTSSGSRSDHRGLVLTRDQLLRAPGGWRTFAPATQHAHGRRAHVRQLRRKLEDAARRRSCDGVSGVKAVALPHRELQKDGRG